MKEIVKLREKQLKNGSKSLYLDFYLNGERRYEFLRLYLNPGNDKTTKAKNKNAIEAARQIQAKRIIDIQSGIAGLPKTKGEMFSSFFKRELLDRHNIAKGTNQRIEYSYRRWIECVGDKPITQINTDDVEKFLMYLEELGLTGSTRKIILSAIATGLNRATKLGMIQFNPIYRIKDELKPRNDCKQREYLTMDELVHLAKSNINPRYTNVKAAFIFACFTGLRYSDIITLEWKDIKNNSIVKSAVKTKSTVIIPLSDNARKWLPEKSTGLVFKIPKHCTLNKILLEWVQQSGLTKHITFHSARHTFATLMLTYGADLYTVSKLLGHTNINTTQVYAKIVDQKKVEAVNLIPEIK